MMKFKNIEIQTKYSGYGKGAKPGMACNITLQYGEKSYEEVTINLAPDAFREVIALAVAKACEQFAGFDVDSIDIDGNPGEPNPTPETRAAELPAPDFAEAL